MALSTQPYKGARDFYPEDKRLQKYMFGIIRSVLEKYGYEEYDAPILEPTELYLSKGNEEIINEQTYSFADRGGRNVTMRTEMTPTVSRMVAARRQESAYPLRWYSIPNCWRYERTQRGRGREFYQLNVDIFGVADQWAEIELIKTVDDILQAFGARRPMYDIKLNHRGFIDQLFNEYLKFTEVQGHSLRTLIDRMHKMDKATFIAKIDSICTPSQREAGAVEKLLAVLEAVKIKDLPAELQAAESIKQLQQVITVLQDSGIKNVEFDISLMRGFDYYTGLVFEVFDTDPDNNRSMFGGGRYDGLVASFGVEPVATVGYAMGDITLLNFLQTHHLLPDLSPETQLYAALVGEVFELAQKPIAELRQMGVNVAVDLSGKKLGDQFKTAEKKGIRYAIIIGEKELADEQFTLKDLKTGEEEKHSLQRIASVVEDYRKQ